MKFYLKFLQFYHYFIQAFMMQIVPLFLQAKSKAGGSFLPSGFFIFPARLILPEPPATLAFFGLLFFPDAIHRIWKFPAQQQFPSAF